MMAPPLLAIDDLFLSFGGVNALLGVDLEVVTDEIHSLIGPNGAGKSSLFNAISGLVRPQRGSIRFRELELVGLPADRVARLGLARTFQNVRLFAEMSVMDNLLLGRHNRMRSGYLSGGLYWGRAQREEERERVLVMEIINALELEDLVRRPVGSLDYGSKKRVALGRALAMEPLLLLLDEPLAGLNQAESRAMVRLLVDVKRRLGLSILLIEHDLSVVMDISDRVSVLNFGELLLSGHPAEVSKDQRVIDAYLGDAGGYPGK